MSDRFAFVRRHELGTLVSALDQALEIIELCDLQETTDGSGALLALPLHDSFRLERALRRAADYLAELQYLGGRP